MAEYLYTAEYYGKLGQEMSYLYMVSYSQYNMVSRVTSFYMYIRLRDVISVYGNSRDVVSV